MRALVLEGYRSGKATQFALSLPTQETRLCGPFEARLVYTLQHLRGPGGPSADAGSVVRRLARPDDD